MVLRFSCNRRRGTSFVPFRIRYSYLACCFSSNETQRYPRRIGREFRKIATHQGKVVTVRSWRMRQIRSMAFLSSILQPRHSRNRLDKQSPRLYARSPPLVDQTLLRVIRMNIKKLAHNPSLWCSAAVPIAARRLQRLRQPEFTTQFDPRAWLMKIRSCDAHK